MRKNQNMTSFSMLAVLLSACGGRGNTTENHRGSGEVSFILRPHDVLAGSPDDVLAGSVDETHEVVRLDTIKEILTGDINTNEGSLGQNYTNLQANNHWQATLTVNYAEPEAPSKTLGWIVEISGPDRDDVKFVQEGEDVRLVTINRVDYEAPTDANGDNVYNVTLTFLTSDDGRITAKREIEFTVNNVEDDDLPIPLLPEEITIQEGRDIISHLYKYGISTAELKGTDAEDLQIRQTDNGPVLEFKSKPEHDSPEDSNKDNVYEILLFADDFDEPVGMEITVAPLPIEL